MKNVDAAIDELMKDSRASIRKARNRGNLPVGKGRAIWFTEEQFETVRRAVDVVRLLSDDLNILDGRAIELACADFLAGVKEHGGPE